MKVIIGKMRLLQLVLIILISINICPISSKAIFCESNKSFINVVSGNWIYYSVDSIDNVTEDDAEEDAKKDDKDEPLRYMAYVPKRVDENTKIMLFLHGNGEADSTWQRVFERYEFVRVLNAKEYILIIPLEKKKCNFQKDAEKLDHIIDEVCEYAGAKREGNLYISGVSAGADAITDVAMKIEFEGAIYMAGSLRDYKKKKSAKDVALLWAGKDVYYFRDNLYTDGGYNYDEHFIDKLKEYSDEGIFNFYTEDLNWEHSHCLVDAVFCSEYMKDEKGQYCHGMLDKLYVDDFNRSLNHILYMLFY